MRATSVDGTRSLRHTRRRNRYCVPCAHGISVPEGAWLKDKTWCKEMILFRLSTRTPSAWRRTLPSPNRAPSSFALTTTRTAEGTITLSAADARIRQQHPPPRASPPRWPRRRWWTRRRTASFSRSLTGPSTRKSSMYSTASLNCTRPRTFITFTRSLAETCAARGVNDVSGTSLTLSLLQHSGHDWPGLREADDG